MLYSVDSYVLFPVFAVFILGKLFLLRLWQGKWFPSLVVPIQLEYDTLESVKRNNDLVWDEWFVKSTTKIISYVDCEVISALLKVICPRIGIVADNCQKCVAVHWSVFLFT